MQLSTFQGAALLAATAAAALPITLSAGDTETEPRPARATAAQKRSAERPQGNRAPGRPPEIRWRRSVAVGSPTAGRLFRGVQLPARGADFVTWDPNLRRSPNRAWRRWGTNHLVRLLLAVAREYGAAHPEAPPLLIGDLSRPHGGDFGRRFGYVWHASHQNGLDADIYFPRSDRTRQAPRHAGDIDRRLSQDLVDRFVRSGATKVFVGPGTGVIGPPGVVQDIPYHDDHMHIRIEFRGVPASTTTVDVQRPSVVTRRQEPSLIRGALRSSVDSSVPLRIEPHAERTTPKLGHGRSLARAVPPNGCERKTRATETPRRAIRLCLLRVRTDDRPMTAGRMRTRPG